jgi:bacterioferritin-associated ferredoxin
MVVCACQGVNEYAVRAAIADGAASVSDIRRACGAGGDCGACCGMLAELVDEARRPTCSGAAASHRVPCSGAVASHGVPAWEHR